ncbi:poly(3-hydroxyalkanoate) depolymerase [Ramlibacter sp. PS4R-6]|uniref:poly(3-hydroxyalkanoate) depolymerase n=1 Tax=Ramlibacter sp. PS4R-6 TaxID=3133438 RepID=UPI0030AFF675
MTADAFEMKMLRADGHVVRVGRRRGAGEGPPLLLFNGIGANIELFEPLARRLPGREVITFDIPGVGHSLLPALPYRLGGIARLAAGILDHYGHERCDALGVSWGGAAAQQFARSQPARCRRLILAATCAGMAMVPATPNILWMMATPRRYIDPAYAQRFAGTLYGGDFRADPQLAAGLHQHVRWQSRMGYYLQIAAVAGWTSIHWLHALEQPTLVMHGTDDPLVPPANAHLMHALIPRSELMLLDCGHMFLLTRAEACARAIHDFLH